MARKLFVAIMAGGPGERFWPKSSPDRPKQFLALIDDQTLLQKAYQRAVRVTDPDRILVVTLARYEALVREQLPGLPADNVILEPFGRDTSAAVALAMAAIERRAPDALMLMKPADHVIGDINGFARATEAAVRAAEVTSSAAALSKSRRWRSPCSLSPAAATCGTVACSSGACPRSRKPSASIRRPWRPASQR